MAWRDGRVDDGSGPENRRIRKGIVGSNPTLSAKCPRSQTGKGPGVKLRYVGVRVPPGVPITKMPP